MPEKLSNFQDSTAINQTIFLPASSVINHFTIFHLIHVLGFVVITEEGTGLLLLTTFKTSFLKIKKLDFSTRTDWQPPKYPKLLSNCLLVSLSIGLFSCFSCSLGYIYIDLAELKFSLFLHKGWAERNSVQNKIYLTFDKQKKNNNYNQLFREGCWNPQL